MWLALEGQGGEELEHCLTCWQWLTCRTPEYSHTGITLFLLRQAMLMWIASCFAELQLSAGRTVALDLCVACFTILHGTTVHSQDAQLFTYSLPLWHNFECVCASHSQGQPGGREANVVCGQDSSAITLPTIANNADAYHRGGSAISCTLSAEAC